MNPVPIHPDVVSVPDDSAPVATDLQGLTVPSHEVGLLDVEERTEAVELGSEDDDGDAPQPGTFAKVGSAMAVLVALIATPYALADTDRALADRFATCPPSIADEEDADCTFARVWVPGEPVPFWNVIGRELMGEGTAEEKAETDVAEAGALAKALLERDETAEPLPTKKPIVPPPPDDGDGNALPPYVPHADDTEDPPAAIELPRDDALDPFFAALARTDAGYAGAITRVSQWGDSVIGGDHVTSALRSSMQRRFGDAGHGFHLLTKPNNSYRHRGIRFSASDWQHCYIINKCKSDAFFGLGGTTVWSGGGAESVFRTVDDGAFGRSWSRVELWYAGQPDGGRIRIKLDGGQPQFVSTRTETFADSWHTLAMDDGSHTLKIRAGGEGRVRMYGAVFERDVPGVVWDGMEQLGAFTSRMLYFDGEHLRRQVEHRDPDLLVFMFGGNDLTLKASKLDRYEATWASTLERFRGPPENDEGQAARPCLLLGPVDHGVRSGPQIVSRPAMPEIVSRQRKAAQAAGCAFFDTAAAMGGEGAAGRWRKADVPLMAADLAHLTHAGQKVLGHYVYLALMQQYVAYRGRTDR